MVRLRIISWNPERSWANWPGNHSSALANRLAGPVRLSPRDTRRLAKSVLNREVTDLNLDGAEEKFSAENVGHFLEVLGAQVSIDEI